MAYRRRVFKKKRRTSMKKRFRKGIRKVNKYDVPLKVTCDITKTVEFRTNWVLGDTSSGRHIISWGADAVGDADNTGLRDSAEFSYWRNKYKRYRVEGVKIKWEPYQWIGGSSAYSYRDLQTATFNESTPVGNMEGNNLKREPDYYQGRASRTWSKYINVRKYIAKRNFPLEVDTGQNYCQATTNLLLNADNFNNGNDLGRVMIRYYVSFMRPNYDLAP